MSDRRPNDEALIGQMIAGRYRIISRLGPGGMGVAYRAWDGNERVPVVIKVPKQLALDDPAIIERFRREARFLRGLSHPHIVPILDVGEHGGRPFVAMRFLPGGSLSNRRLRHQDGTPRSNPPGMLKLWLPAVAESLDFVHSLGVVHRDVKPSNIFFDARWGAFLGDFGVAKIVEESESFDRENTLTATNMGIGTQGYMGPEHFSPKSIIDGRADQYSLAVTAYEWISGSRPFRGDTDHIVVEILTRPVPPLTLAQGRLPESLVAAVNRGLAKNPEDRFPTCEQFAAAVLQDLPRVGDNPGLVHLLCASCPSVITFSETRAGQSIDCPRCSARLQVAEDLAALWIEGEASTQHPENSLARFISGLTPAAGKSARSQSRRETNSSRRWGKKVTRNTVLRIALGSLAAAAIVLAVAVFRHWLIGTEHFAFSKAQSIKRTSLAGSVQWKLANATIGRYLCLVKQEWDKAGLDALIKSELLGFSNCANKERELESRVGGSGRWFEAADEWWRLLRKPYIQIYDARSGKKRALNAQERQSLELHARDLYFRALSGKRTEDERKIGRRLYYSDKKFQELVGYREP